MHFKQTKLLATAAVAALMGVVYAPASSNAAPLTPTVIASITTSSAITVADGQDMNFGTWFILFRNADNFTLRLDTAGVITPVGIGPTPATDSIAVNLLAGAQVGTVTASLPAGLTDVIINMQRAAITDFTDLALTLNNITYMTADYSESAVPAVTNVPVNINVGGTPETVSFGADVEVTGNPADAVHTASFVVSFSY